MKRAKRIGLLTLTCLTALPGVVPAGCASSSRGPYSTLTPESRNPLEAHRLTVLAGELIDRDPGRAEDLLRQALTFDLYHGPAHNNLGVLYLKQNRLYEAANEFEWSARLMPDHPDPRMNLALVLERAGRTEEALAAYATALEVQPGHVPTVQAYVRCQLRHGRADDRTCALLETVALQGTTSEWREWARTRLALREGVSRP